MFAYTIIFNSFYYFLFLLFMFLLEFYRKILESNSTVTVPDDDGWTDDEESGENMEPDTNKKSQGKGIYINYILEEIIIKWKIIFK